jgi:MFS family permease
VATTFLNWLPKFIFDTFHYDVAQSSLISTAWPLASLIGALSGGVIADWASRKSPGGRIMVQSAALMLAAPFVFITGWSPSLSIVVVALIGAGLCKGFYDANIFAALYDVIPARDRGTAAGVMNTAGWTIGALVPYAVGVASTRYGMGGAIASTAFIYVLVSLLAAIACRLAITRARSLKLTTGEPQP